MLNWQHMVDGMIPKHHQDLFVTPAFPAQGLSAMLVSPGKGSCRHHKFACAFARCHCKQWVPGRLIGLGVRSFRLKILQQNPIFLWIVKNNGFLAATKQLYKWYFPSVCLSVRPSVCPSVRPSVRPSHLFDYVPIIVSSWNFHELLPVTEVTSMQKVKVRGQRSRSQWSQPNFTVSGL